MRLMKAKLANRISQLVMTQVSAAVDEVTRRPARLVLGWVH